MVRKENLQVTHGALLEVVAARVAIQVAPAPLVQRPECDGQSPPRSPQRAPRLGVAAEPLHGYAKPQGRPLVDTFITEVSQDTWIFFPWDMGLSFQPPIAEHG